jgi:RNA polymerase sigma-70 factor, ECF subfamily
MPRPGFLQRDAPRVEAWSADAGDDDATLVARAQVDRQVFGLLYRRYVAAVYRYCYHRLGSTQAAEDATSEVFLKALGALPRHRPGQSFRSWLFVIAHNVVTDSYRARRPSAPLEEGGEVVDPTPTPEEFALAAEGDRAARALLARLSPDQARVLELRLAGLTGPEIARVLGRSLASVKIAQVRGYARLRQLLGATSRAEVRDGDR